MATKNKSGPISWYAQRIIQNERLVTFESLGWQQTTKEILKQGDFTIFMQQEHYDYCREKLDFTQEDYEIWDIKDMYEFISPYVDKRLAIEKDKIKTSEETFKIIKRKTDDLVNRLSKKQKKF